MDMIKMSDDQLEKVIGGISVFPEEKADFRKGIHPGCGGRITGRGDLFGNARCERCGEEHPRYEDFFHFGSNPPKG